MHHADAHSVRSTTTGLLGTRRHSLYRRRHCTVPTDADQYAQSVRALVRGQRRRCDLRRGESLPAHLYLRKWHMRAVRPDPEPVAAFCG